MRFLAGFLTVAIWPLMVMNLHASVGTNPDGTRYADSDDLVVTVTPETGMISVLDKANNYTWVQRANTSHTAFTSVTLFPAQNCIGFNTTYFPASGGTSPGRLFTWTELWLDGRKLKVKVNIDDHKTVMGAFDGIEPFQPAAGMSLVLADFCDGHMYPCNLSSWPLYNLDSIRILNLLMPWAGVVDSSDGKGYAVMCDTPFDAQLKLRRFRGVRSPLIAWNPEKGRFGYTRSMTYYFTADGGYVALAKAFRSRAATNGLVKPLAEKALSRPQITNLYGAPIFWDFNGWLPPAMLKALGVARGFYHVERWDSVHNSLAAVTNAGFIADEYDYYTAGPVDGGAQSYQSYHIASNQCVKTESGDIFMIGGWGARCSEFFRPVGQGIIPARLAAYPAGARYIDQMTQNILGHDSGPDGGGATFECYDPNHPKTRTDWVNDCVGIYRWLAEDLKLITGAELGKFFQVPFTEVFHGVGSWFWPWPDVSFPTGIGTDTNAWKTYDEWAMNPAARVPLWQLVFHDCTVGSWYPWDGNDVCHRFDTHYQDLKDCLNVLYGTPAVFLVTGNSSSGSGSQFFNTAFGQRQRWLQSYRNTCKSLEFLAEKEMTSHSFLTADRAVQQTLWSDGAKVIVNFGTNLFTTDSVAGDPRCLAQYCFDVEGPWGGAVRSFDTNSGRIVTHLWNENYSFDDEQTSATNRLAIALHRAAPNYIRVNVDQPAGAVDFVIHPLRVQPVWDFASTHVWACSAATGIRQVELLWTSSGTNGIKVTGLSGSIVLDVVCDAPRPVLQISVPATNSAAHLSLVGIQGSPCRIEFTGDLLNPHWQTLAESPALPGWTNEFSDATICASTNQRFYRAVGTAP